MSSGESFTTATAPVKVRFTGPVSAASLSKETVFAIDLGEKGKLAFAAPEVTLDYQPCDASLTFIPRAPFAMGHTYLFAGRGGLTARWLGPAK